jgi:isopentenyldiphosphate isomerase
MQPGRELKTDNMTEILDIYDENRTHLGVKDRDAVHRDGDWHCTFHCWVIYRGGDGIDYILMQKRGPDKELFPNMLDITAAGHYEAGETVIDGVREIKEELGVDVRFDALIPVGSRLGVARYNGLIDREFNDVFFLVSDAPLSAYHIQQEEVSGLVRIAIDDGLALFAGERDSISGEAVGLGAAVVDMRLEDFIVSQDRYTYRAMVLAKRCLNGEKHLVI